MPEQTVPQWLTDPSAATASLALAEVAELTPALVEAAAVALAEAATVTLVFAEVATVVPETEWAEVGTKQQRQQSDSALASQQTWRPLASADTPSYRPHCGVVYIV